jgi:hypothetical protein
MISRVETYVDPSFIAEVHAWAKEQCARRGRAIVGPIEQPHIRPWSTVFRIPTSAGALYLKVCGPSQAHEPRLTALLQREVPDLVPAVLAVHPTKPWMLIDDGGVKLREAFTGDAVLAAWRSVLPRYAELQRALTPHVAEMLAFGTPDHRLALLATRFADIIEDERSVAIERPERLSESERSTMRALVPTLEQRCRELAALGVAETAEHDDLHDGNVLVRGERRVIFDWGDACVAHPFLTLSVTLRFAADRAGQEERAPAILALRDAYLEPWSDLATPNELRRAADLAFRLGFVSRALTWYVVVKHYPGVLEHYPGGLSGSLRRVLELVGSHPR